jgi:uncharacterized protein YndB with AHSA1/START domain
MPTTPSADGTVEEADGRYVLRFERRLRHPRERVWDALTRPERLREWFGDVEVDLELVEGGRYEVRTTGPPELVDAIVAEAGKEALVQHNTILRVEPPALLEHTFGAPDSVVRWELRPDGDGCRLLLTHTEPPGFSVSEHGPRDLAGWHALLELLARALDGSPAPWRLERWQQLRDAYAAGHDR